MPPIPPLKLYESAKLMDSFEKPKHPGWHPNYRGRDNSEQKEAANPEERQEQQQTEEHKAVMKFFTSIANALNKGYKFEEKATLEWRLVVGVARQYGWVGEDTEALRVFRMLDLLSSSYKVRREKMLAQFRPGNAPQE